MTAHPKAASPQPAGNSEAIDWEAVLTQHDRWLRAVILARVRNPEAVEEVMQEVALAAVRQAAPLHDSSKVAPWLYRLAVLQSLLYRRKCARRRQLRERYAQRLAQNEARVGPVDPLAWLVAEERQRALADALQRLAPRDAEILLLKYTQQWNYHQIAEHLGVSHAAVETRLHRARERLRRELAALYPDHDTERKGGRPVRERAAAQT